MVYLMTEAKSDCLRSDPLVRSQCRTLNYSFGRRLAI